jgi:hypothetical protein
MRRETTEKEMAEELTKSERKQIAEILDRRANEIAGFSGDYKKDGNHFGSVELALSREIERLRRLADRVNPADAEDDDA